MATQLSIVNKVLRRLRESEVSTVASSTYSKLIGEFLDAVKEELEDLAPDLYPWYQYNTDVTIQLSTGVREYDLTDLGIVSSALNDRARVMLLPQAPQYPQAYLTDSSPPKQCTIVAPDFIRYGWETEESATSTDAPYVFAVEGTTLLLQDAPDAAMQMKIRFNVPQSTLEVDGTDDATELQLPSRPLFLGTLYHALNERGEEMGEPGHLAERRYGEASAVALEDNTRFQNHKAMFTNDEVR